MSWEKLIKGSQNLKSSLITKSEAKEFHKDVLNLERLENVSKKTVKHVKILNESEAAVARSEQKLVSDLISSAVFQDDDVMRCGLQDWSSIAKNNEESSQILTSATNKVLVEPLKRLNANLPTVQEAIKKRERLLLEYYKWYQKVEKYRRKERRGENIVKLKLYQKNFDGAKIEYEEHARMMMSEMPSLYDGRIAYLKPSFKAFVNLQLQHYGQCYKSYTELYHTITSTPEALKQISPQSLISEIKSLSIVAPD